MIMTFLLLTKLPRGPQSSQWLISTMQSLSDLLCISHPIFTHSKETAMPWVSPAQTGQSLLYPLPTLAVCHCFDLLSVPRIFFLLLTPSMHLYAHSSIGRAFARTTLSSSVPPLPLPFLSRVGLPLSFTAVGRIEKGMKPDPLGAR